MRKFILVLFIVPMAYLLGESLVSLDSSSPEKTQLTGITISSDRTQITLTNSVASYAVAGTNASAGAASAGLVVKLDANGKIDSSMALNTFSRTNIYLSSFTAGTAFTWSTVTNVTTTGTNGVVVVRGAAVGSAANNIVWLRLRDSTTNMTAQGFNNTSSGGYGHPIVSATLTDALSGATKNYVLEVSAASSSYIFTNAAPSTAASPPFEGTNNFNIEILEIR